MTHKNGMFVLALALGFLFTAGSAQAQLLDANGYVSGSVEVNADSDAADADASANASADTDTDANGSEAMQEDRSEDAGFNILRRTLPRDLGDAAAPEARATDVTDAASLRAYAEASLRNDDRFDGIVMNDQGMQVTYRKNARLFGVIPSGMNVSIRVDGDGEVSVDYPWYSFLYATEETRDELASRIESELASADAGASASADMRAAAEEDSANVAEAASVDASMSYDSQRWARVLERIQATLSADAAVEAS